MRTSDARLARRWRSVALIAICLAAPMSVSAWTGKPLAYVTASLERVVRVIDTGDNEFVAEFPIAIDSNAAIVSPDGTHLYVTDGIHSAVSVFALNKKTAIPKRSIPVGSGATALVMSADSATLYVVNGNDSTVSVVDINTQTVIDTIPVGNEATAASLTPDGKQLLVTSLVFDQVWVFDTASHALIKKIPVPRGPSALIAQPGGSNVFVVSYFAVSVIDVRTLSVVDSATMGHQLLGGTLLPNSTKLYVSDRAGNAVLIVDTRTLAITHSIPTLTPEAMAMTPDGHQVYVASLFDNTVSAIDTKTNSITRVFTGIEQAWSVAIIPPPGSASVSDETPPAPGGHGLVGVTPISPDDSPP